MFYTIRYYRPEWAAARYAERGVDKPEGWVNSRFRFPFLSAAQADVDKLTQRGVRVQVAEVNSLAESANS